MNRRVAEQAKAGLASLPQGAWQRGEIVVRIFVDKVSKRYNITTLTPYY